MGWFSKKSENKKGSQKLCRDDTLAILGETKRCYGCRKATLSKDLKKINGLNYCPDCVSKEAPDFENI